MADITGRVRKKAAGLLDAGEEVIAALLVEPKGTYGVASIAIAALPRTSVRMLADRAANASANDGGLAASFPSGSTALVVTDRRVLAIPSNGIGFSSIAAAYARSDLSVTDHVSKGFGRRLLLAFADGTNLTVDAQRGQPFDAFTAAVGRPE